MSPRLAYFAAVVAILLGALFLRLWDPAPVARLRLMVFDAYQQLKPRDYTPDLPVRVVDIDEESLKRHGQWPWPRTVLADMVRSLRDQGAAAIAFDIVFPEADRLSPEQFVAHLPDREALRALIEERIGPQPHDALFADAIAQAPVALGFIALPDGAGPAPPVKAGFAHAGDDPKLFLPRFGGAAASLEELQTSAHGSGALNWIPEYDQIVRRLPLLVNVGDTVHPSLAVEVLRIAQGASTLLVRASGASGEYAFGAQTGITHLRVGDFVVPTDATGAMWLWFTPSQRARFIPAWRVIAGQLPPGEVEGRIVLIGASAAGLYDLRSTPLEASVPGVELTAQAIEQIVQEQFLRRPDFIAPAELITMLMLALLIATLVYRLGAVGGAVAGIAAVAGVVAASWYAFDRFGWLVDPVFPALSLAAVYVAGTGLVFLRTERERNRVRSAFSHYMAPALVERLAADPSRLKLGGEMRTMTLLFGDVRGFTALSEGLSAEELTSFVNGLFTPLSNVILEERGTIDKYMGDAVMAFWNAPLDDPDHARNACRAALRMVARLEGLNEDWRRPAEAQGRPFRPVAMGIGLNTGACCVGNLGSEKRFDYSVIGDDVNVAARLEGQTKVYGVPIVVGEETARLAPEFALLELDRIAVKGKAQALRAYGLLGDAETAGGEDFKRLNALHLEMLDHMRARRWDEAERLIAECEAANSFALAALYRHYRARIAAWRQSPPPDGWDGSVAAETK